MSEMSLIFKSDFCYFLLQQAVAGCRVFPKKACCHSGFCCCRNASQVLLAFHGMQGVSGSNPLGSTSRIKLVTDRFFGGT